MRSGKSCRVSSYKFISVFIFLLIFSSLPFTTFLSFAKSKSILKKWHKQKSTHFNVYYQKDFSSDYIGKFLGKAENYYGRITDKFGFKRFNFWTWDNRCNVYLYSSRKDYYNDTGRPQWSSASANIRSREIVAFMSDKNFTDAILAHEMTHLIFREFVGADTPLPLWLDEGVATSVEGDIKNRRVVFARQLVESGFFISLDTLTQITPDTLILPDIFYAQSASIIEFLLGKYGREKFVYFCRKIRDGDYWWPALKSTYGFDSLADMEEKWKKFLSK